MGPSLVIQLDKKGEIDVRGNSTAFDIPKSSGQSTSNQLSPVLPESLVGFDLSPSGCLQPHFQPSLWEQIMEKGCVSQVHGCGSLESAKAGRSWG